MKIYAVTALRYFDDHKTYPGYVVGSFDCRELAEERIDHEVEITGRDKDTYIIEIYEI
jgi:hypothetical protein